MAGAAAQYIFRELCIYVRRQCCRTLVVGSDSGTSYILCRHTLGNMAQLTTKAWSRCPAISIALPLTECTGPNGDTPSLRQWTRAPWYQNCWGAHLQGYPYMHDASAYKNLHFSNASRTIHAETHLQTQNTAQTVYTTTFILWTAPRPSKAQQHTESTAAQRKHIEYKAAVAAAAVALTHSM